MTSLNHRKKNMMYYHLWTSSPLNIFLSVLSISNWIDIDRFIIIGVYWTRTFKISRIYTICVPNRFNICMYSIIGTPLSMKVNVFLTKRFKFTLFWEKIILQVYLGESRTVWSEMEDKPLEPWSKSGQSGNDLMMLLQTLIWFNLELDNYTWLERSWLNCGWLDCPGLD